MWRSTTIAWPERPDVTQLGWEADGAHVWIEESFPDDIELLLKRDRTEEEDTMDDDGDNSSDEKSDEDIDEEEDHDDMFIWKLRTTKWMDFFNVLL